MKRLYDAIRLDINHNPYKLRIVILLVLFRVSNHFYSSRFRLIFFPLFILYRFFSEWLCSIELRPGTHVGAPLIIDHGYNIIINKNASLGSHVHLRHGVTIGVRNNAQEKLKISPVIGDGVSIGCNVSILGQVRIGDHTSLGAHLLVLSNIPANAIVVPEISYRNLQPKADH
jgi:putative colanic acid biosynthesis acetyltransferase WcaB